MKAESRLVALLAMLFMFVACSEDDNNPPVSGGMSGGVYYVLNSGDWKSNNSSITRYDASTGAVTQGYFESVNGRKLGNTANDMIIYGGKQLQGSSVESYGDHRIAMALAVAALGADGNTLIRDGECCQVTYPAFAEDFAKLGVSIKERM